MLSNPISSQPRPSVTQCRMVQRRSDPAQENAIDGFSAKADRRFADRRWSGRASAASICRDHLTLRIVELEVPPFDSPQKEILVALPAGELPEPSEAVPSSGL